MAFADVMTTYADWRTISIAAAAVGVLGSAALIMLSRLFALRNLEQVAKTEFVYAASTVLIVVMVVGMINLAEPKLGGSSDSLARCLYLASFGIQCNAGPTVFPAETLIDWMKLYMETPTKCVQQFMSYLYALAIPIDAMATVYMEVFMSEHASGFGVKWISERISNATASFAFYMYMFYFMIHVLNFIKYYAGFFFSIGVALRAFPPTRGAGAYIMALAFGLYFVFPLSYILIATFSLPHAQANLVTFRPDAFGGPAYTCSLPTVPDMSFYACGAADAGRMLEFRDVVLSNAEQLDTLVSLQLPDFERNLVHSICVFPMMALVVLLTFVLNATNLFGGQIPEIGRGLVKLI
ncbi:MAG: hypothetical protein AB1324_00905 [Candidatus Micrarchaeota archaeon]